MFTLVVGGAASGKSEYAEQLILRAGALPRYYVATMEPFGAEARARIARHRVLRAQKRFETIECPVGLSRVLLPARGAALLECLSNLAANELYSPAGAGGEQAALAAVVDGVESLRRQCEALVVVTGEVFSGGSAYAGDTGTYLRVLAAANRALCLAPVLVTGGIHLDGYADTCDALASCAAPEKKQEILKDPHCGAFSVIRLCTYFTAYLGLCAAVDCTPRAVLCMGLGFVLERALSGYAIAAFPLAKNTGLAHTFATGADRTAVRRALLVLCALAAAGMAAAGGMTGAAMALAVVLVFLRYRAVAQKQFGGISGDLAGWFLQKAELWMLAALAACSLLSGVTG